MRVTTAPNRDDSNWLVVRGHVETANGAWDFRDPCLQTWDLKSLAAWFDAASKGYRCGSLGFIEPNLSLESAKPERDGSAMRVTVNFALEARPPWARGGDFETPIDFVFAKRELFDAAAEFSRSLAQYPER